MARKNGMNREELGYEFLLQNQVGSMKTSLLVCVSLLIAGVVLLVNRITISWLFLLMGGMLAVGLIYRYSAFRKELAKIDDLSSFKKQLADAKNYDLFGLYMSEDYVVLERPTLKVYPLRDMEKFEVGIAGQMSKALFLTGWNGVRNKIAETSKGDATQKDFDELYLRVREYFNTRDN